MQSRRTPGKGITAQRCERCSGGHQAPAQLIRLPPLAWLRTWCAEHEMFLFLLHRQPAGLGGMWSSSLFPFISTPLLHGFVAVSDFAFAILTQTPRIHGVNYYLFWDIWPGSPTSWLQLWQQEEFVFRGKKKSSSCLSVVMSVCVGRVELAGSLTVLLWPTSIPHWRDEAAQKQSQRKTFKTQQQKMDV